MSSVGIPAPNFSPEPLGGDSLTQILRGTTNQAGQAGTNLLNAGMPVFNSGTAGIGTAMGTAGTALGTLDPAVAFYKTILSGDPNAINKAISPAATTLSTAYQQAIKNAQQFMPRGGARSSTVAGLPFQQAQDLFNLVAQLQPQAAAGLNNIAGTQTGIANTQGGLASSLMQGGLGVSGLGGNLLNTTLQSLLARRGQNVQEHGQAMGLAGQLGSSLGSGSFSSTPTSTSVSWSDRRLKRDITKVGILKGVPVYLFRYLWNDVPEIGVMADELEKHLPAAVIKSNLGPPENPFRLVDYAAVGRWLSEA